MRIGLVLGGGGTVGIAYHAGVLSALAEVGGITPDRCDVIVGTSAGALVGGLLRSGFDADDLWQWAQGTHPLLAGADLDDVKRRRAGLMVPAFHNPIDIVRRSLGSAWVVSRSIARFPTIPVPRFAARLFPAGMLSMAEARSDLGQHLVEGWPSKDLWLVAFDISNGSRVVFGSPGSPEADIREAVVASCAIPGIYPPVRIGPRLLVDGGVDSTSHLDLAIEARCDLIVGVIPMAFDTDHPPNVAQQLLRRIPSRSLAAEVKLARARGAEVLLLRPTRRELGLHGWNLMRRDGWEKIASAAYEETARRLDTPRFRDALVGAL